MIGTILLCGVAGAAPPPKLTVPKVPFEKSVLPNGLELILHVDKKLPLVHVNLWYHVGSKNEKVGRTGLAHLFEHLMLQGSKNAPEDFFSLMQKTGAQPGRDSNGTTDNDRTNYFSTAPSGSLEFLLWVHSDLTATLADSLTQAKVDNQRDVVRNERRQGIDNQPYGRADILLVENLFPAGHPYSWPVIGSHEDLQAASLEDAKTFFRRFYTPNNLSLTITGDFDPATAKKLVEKYFGSIPPGPALERPKVDIPKLDGEKIVDVNDRVPQERIFIAWPTPQIGAPGVADLDIAASILSDGLTSRLKKSLLYDKKLASAAVASTNTYEIAGYFEVDVTARPGSQLADIDRAVTAEIGRLAKEGPTAAEVERAKTKIITAGVTNLERLGAFGGVADILNFYNIYWGDPAKLEEDVQRTLKATPASVKSVVGKWLDTPNRVVLRFHPENSARSTVADIDRTKRPALGPDTAFHAPQVAVDKLANGLEIYVVEQHDLPLVTAAIAARAGSVLDPPGKEGLAWLATDAMSRGTKTRSALAIADAFGDLGEAVRSQTFFERATQSISVAKGNVPSAVALLADLVRNPAYADAEVDRERKLQLDAIEQAEKSGPQLAARIWPMLAFGANHPYAHPVIGWKRSVGTLTGADLTAFHGSVWKPGAVALILVGDITPAEAKALAQKELGSWSGAAPAPPAIPAAAPSQKGKIILIDRPDAAQTYAVELYGAPAQKADDYYAWRLAAQVLGGGFAGRLNINLRQDKGYSYGFFGQTPLYAGGLVWMSGGTVQTDKTKETVVELAKELRGIAGDKPVAAKELDDARLGYIRNYAAGFGTNVDTAGRVVELWSRRWPMTELEREPAELAKVPLDAVLAAAKKYGVPANGTILLVGDRAKIEAGVRGTKLGDVVIFDSAGRPVGAQ